MSDAHPDLRENQADLAAVPVHQFVDCVLILEVRLGVCSAEPLWVKSNHLAGIGVADDLLAGPSPATFRTPS
ncbi:MAG: hypothetical protein WCO90_12615 [Planctomycetota bacterium]